MAEIVIIKNIESADFWVKGCGLDPILMHRGGRLFTLKIEILVDDPSDESASEAIPDASSLQDIKKEVADAGQT